MDHSLAGKHEITVANILIQQQVSETQTGEQNVAALTGVLHF